MVVKLDKISQRAAKKMDEIVKKHDVSASFSDELLCSSQQHLLNKVNRVTSNFRHGRKVSDKDLTALCDAQVEFERKLREEITSTQKDMGELLVRYNKLIMTVERKWPGETRHETALKYIRQAEEPSNDRCAKQDT